MILQLRQGKAGIRGQVRELDAEITEVVVSRKLSAAALAGALAWVAGCASNATPTEPPTRASLGVVVSSSKNCARFCNVLAIFDLHTEADTENKGFDELRRLASAIGADAVIDAAFEHGQAGELSHLSGMAVRYSAAPPSYEELGPIDVRTPANAADKGIDELRRRATELGADAVVGVTFEHGEDGAPSRLHGTAVRRRR